MSTLKPKNRFYCSESAPEMHKCKHCNFGSPLKVVLRKHIAEIHNQKQNDALKIIVKNYECQYCNRQTHSRLIFSLHNCDPCLNELKCNSSSHKNNSKHLQDTIWFECDKVDCSYICKQKGNLKRHLIVKHGPPDQLKWFQCEHCCYKSKNKRGLELHHINKHGTEREKLDLKKFKCTQCPFRALYQGVLKQHMANKHNIDVQWFHCERCPYRGKQAIHLKIHMLAKHQCGYI